MTETLEPGYSSERKFCFLVLWMKVASAFKGLMLTWSKAADKFNEILQAKVKLEGMIFEGGMLL